MSAKLVLWLTIMDYTCVLTMVHIPLWLKNMFQNDKVCIICLEKSDELYQMCDHNCNSYYHIECWIKCMKMEYRCPMCRKYLDPKFVRYTVTDKIQERFSKRVGYYITVTCIVVLGLTITVNIMVSLMS